MDLQNLYCVLLPILAILVIRDWRNWQREEQERQRVISQWHKEREVDRKAKDAQS